METVSAEFFRQVSRMDLPRFAGVPTFMRLPHVTPDHPAYEQVQMGLWACLGMLAPPTDLAPVTARDRYATCRP